jgi:hypothetical protein
MRKSLLTAMAMLFCVSAIAQIEFSKEKFGSTIEGHIIKSDGKMVRGHIMYAHPVLLSKEVMFNGTVYKPDELKEFFVNDIRWISVTALRKKQFAPVAIDGPVTTYWIMSYPEGVSYTDENTPYEKSEFLKKLDGDPVASATLLLGFKKKMSAFLSDHEELAKKIAKKETGYGMMGYNDIIKEYNDWYIEEHPEYMAEKEAAMAAAAAGPPIPESDIVLPEGLYGKWNHESYTYTIGKNSIQFDYDMGGGNTVNTEYLISEYDEEQGFICGTLVKYMSFGFDAMANYQDHVGFIYFTELTEDTVLMRFQGHGVIAAADKYALHEDKDYTRSLGRKYNRVE